jgi:hypothetical protein
MMPGSKDSDGNLPYQQQQWCELVANFLVFVRESNFQSGIGIATKEDYDLIDKCFRFVLNS